MRVSRVGARPSSVVPMAVALLLAGAARGWAQDTTRTRYNIYGFAQADFIYDFKQTDPNWFDVVRPTKLPAFEDQFGRDGNFWSSVRQTRFGVKGFIPTGLGEVRTTFEFDMFGVGPDAGQTTIRPRHFYGELGHFGAGQTNSPFMDVDVFPNTIEYWGPSGMLFFRNIQVAWMPIQGRTRLTIALERPGASGDAGNFAQRIELQNVKGRFPLPDLSAEYRLGTPWGYVEAAGMLRYIKVDDLLADTINLNKTLVGGGGSLSSNVNFNAKKDVLRLQVVYGTGIQNYFNDAPADVAPRNNFSDPVRPIVAEVLPILGITSYLDHTWSERFSSSIGYSLVDIDNSTGQAPSAFNRGQYASANLLYYPVKNVLAGAEFQWGHRKNFSDGFDVDDFRLQFSFKYSFSFSNTPSTTATP
jgi:hypothetical protein